MPETVVDDGTVWRLLSDPRRRRILKHLDASDGVTTVADVAKSALEGYDGDRVGLEVELRHVDVPMLADAGVVAYDAERDRIEPTDRVEQLCRALEAVETCLESPTETY